MVNKKFAFIQFLMDQEYAADVAHIDVMPQPDHSRRIFMNFSTIDKYDPDLITTPVQTSTFLRTGLTLIEWGGAEIQHPTLTNQQF